MYYTVLHCHSYDLFYYYCCFYYYFCPSVLLLLLQILLLFVLLYCHAEATLTYTTTIRTTEIFLIQLDRQKSIEVLLSVPLLCYYCSH